MLFCKLHILYYFNRSKTLWALNDKLSAFQKKLNKLYLSIRYYTMSDVWNITRMNRRSLTG